MNSDKSCGLYKCLESYTVFFSEDAQKMWNPGGRLTINPGDLFMLIEGPMVSKYAASSPNAVFYTSFKIMMVGTGQVCYLIFHNMELERQRSLPRNKGKIIPSCSRVRSLSQLKKKGKGEQ